jgi:hypothetical protein
MQILCFAICDSLHEVHAALSIRQAV